VVSKGENCSLEDIHDAWSIWKISIDSEHPHIIPFDELSSDVKELDREYMEAVVEVAEEWKRMR